MVKLPDSKLQFLLTFIIQQYTLHRSDFSYWPVKKYRYLISVKLPDNKLHAVFKLMI